MRDEEIKESLIDINKSKDFINNNRRNSNMKTEKIEIKSRSDLEAMMKIQQILDKDEDYNSDEDSLNGWDYFALDAVEERNKKDENK